ncbi:MAG TPA: hypothetical protein VGO27_10040 [Candidatus Acidoferrum sp.]|jgi:hypothetical protein|nr:hypothetical protein [Candidatus Acidoferrum sp.]
MRSDALTTYLQDHLAGALHAIELLKAMRDHFAEKPLGTFARELLAEVESDRDVLAGLTKRVSGTAGGMKEWGAWLAEKVSRLKLKHGSADGLGTFEALEFLAIGIHGKRALWRAMEVVRASDSRLQSIDFTSLIARAEDQHQKVEELRLACAQSVFHSGGDDGEPRHTGSKTQED